MKLKSYYLGKVEIKCLLHDFWFQKVCKKLERRFTSRGKYFGAKRMKCNPRFSPGKRIFFFSSFFRALKLRFDKREKDERLPLPILKKNSADEKFFTADEMTARRKENCFLVRLKRLNFVFKLISCATYGTNLRSRLLRRIPVFISSIFYHLFFYESFVSTPFRSLKEEIREKKNYSISFSLSPSAFQFVPYIAD